MSKKQQEVDEAFLNFVTERGIISALDAETLRSELRRRKSTQKNITMQQLLVHKGHMTYEHAGQLHDQMMGALSQPTLVPESGPGPAPPAQETGQPTLVPGSESGPATLHPDTDQTDRAPQSGNGQRHTDRRPTGPVNESQKPTDRRPTGPVNESQKPTDRQTTDQLRRDTTARNTRPVDDSQASTGSGQKRGTKGTDNWNIHGDTDKLTQTDKMVPAGTVIAASEMTIAQMREQIGLDEGVKLVSDKMESTLAQYQPDATADKKRYVVIREIARGGMGKVLEVEDTELRRSVALKVLRKELLGRRDVVERFLEEAQITGQLEHPNIVPVHEMGVDGAGNLYFTMKFVEGMSLAEILLKLREGNRDMLREYPLMRLLDTFIKICEGLSFAHNRGVIHRDLKPANIMVGRFGEVQVMDWGVAKVIGRQTYSSEDESNIVLTDRLDAGAVHTMMGAVIGTPSYMSPEQARGDIEEIDHTSDIFSLGVILYEMLALRSPWTGKSSDEVLEQVREMTPIKPRERNPEVEPPTELERLALRCLEKEKPDRIQTVKELAENVRSFIEGRAMGSVEYSAMRLAAKWVARHRKEVAYFSLALIAVAAGVLGTLWYLQTLEQEKILGLSDTAQTELALWEEDAEAGEYDAASEHVDVAKDMFQRVLAVDDTDEAAQAGLVKVKEAETKIREMRANATMEEIRLSKLNDLKQQAKDHIKSGKRDNVFGHRKLDDAMDAAGAALALEPDDKEALLYKATAANELAKFWRERRKWDLMNHWIDVLEETGLLKSQLEERKDEHRRRLTKGNRD